MTFLRRLVPDGLAARLAILLVAALLAANLVSLALLSSERDRLGREARLDRTIERMIGAVPLLETLPRSERARVLRRVDRRFVAVSVSVRPAAIATGDQMTELVARIRQELGGERIVHAQQRGPQRRLLISIELAHNDAGPTEWLNASIRASPGQRRGDGLPALLTVIILSLAAVLGVGLLFVRRLTRPLAELAKAARAAGNGDRAVRVEETGAREFRDAAAAFNDMQARIARFDAERTRTLAAVGHDLRTPITSLRIRAEMLEDDARDPMVRTLDEMRVMADGLVAYARGDGDGEATQNLDIAEMLARLSQERGATFSNGAPLVVRGRPVALMRAFGNLIDNAIRYGGAARVAVLQDSGIAKVTVEDDGPGIPDDRLDEMFEPFVRGDVSRSSTTGGAGLGLSIARAIVRSHGGSLKLANANPGLRAEVTLPLV
ncbi:ATP-binding protein [Rhizobiaceae bacterium]|nr:ATP-binding protein [Rhizobiaceae bacterium]